jgi:segregation and condensation protein B
MSMNGETQSAGAAFWAARGVRIEPEPDLETEREPADGPETGLTGDSGPEAAQAGAGAQPDGESDVGFEDEVGGESDVDVESDDEAAVEADAALPPMAIPAQSQASLDDIEPQDGDLVDGLAALNASLAEAQRSRAGRPVPEPAWQLASESTALPPLKACLEAILMVVDEPVTVVVLAQVVERPKAEVGDALRELAEEYTAQGRGFELREVGVADGGGTGWRMYSRVECAPVVERFVRDGQQAKLTQAALETLAVVAYRQPVSRSKVSAIRGVNCDGVMRTLLARGLVEECGTEHETGALLYQTTGYFLERMGLKGLDELPDLAPLLPSAAEVEDEA